MPLFPQRMQKFREDSALRRGLRLISGISWVGRLQGLLMIFLTGKDIKLQRPGGRYNHNDFRNLNKNWFSTSICLFSILKDKENCEKIFEKIYLEKLRKNFQNFFSLFFSWKRGLSEILFQSVKKFQSKFHQKLSFRQDLAKLKGLFRLRKITVPFLRIDFMYKLTFNLSVSRIISNLQIHNTFIMPLSLSRNTKIIKKASQKSISPLWYFKFIIVHKFKPIL